MNFEQTIQSQATQFLDAIFFKIQTHQIELLPHWTIDHLCYRVETIKEYQEYKSLFLKIAKCLIESEVNGRMIATFKLNQPINFRNYTIDVIEVPAPKKGKIVKTGFEHIEVVCDVPFEEIIEKYPHLNFDTSGLSKIYNQELEVNLDGQALKFHHQSLEDVIREELS
jgi:predicted metalloenzyme YecM